MSDGIRDRAPAARSVPDRLLTRPTLLAGALILPLIVLAWMQLLNGSPTAGLVSHRAHAGLALTHAVSHSVEPRDLGMAFLMWLLMAVAMMLPTAAPAILSFNDIARAGHRTVAASARIGAFVFGYLCAWGGFGVLATATQWGLTTALHGVPATGYVRTMLAGAPLVGAGIYQFSAVKDHCLAQCHSPMTYFLAHWRDGLRGAAYLGLRHGIHCVGCCWALMALMLFAGTMNIAWTVGLTALMLLEKIAPKGRAVGRAAGLALIVWGVVLIAFPLLRR